MSLTRRDFLASSALLSAAACRRAPEPAAPGEAATPQPRGLAQVLVIDGGPMASYAMEILAAEGIIGLQRADPALEPAAQLATCAAALTYGPAVPPPWIEALEAFVRRGHTLVAVCPPDALTRRVGGPPATSLVSGVTGCELTASGPDPEGLRVHVPARAWPVDAADASAWMLGSDGRRHPAVVESRVGLGRAVLWAFDVVSNIAAIRQGRQDGVDPGSDGLPGRRLSDALAGWARPERLERPDADVFQRELVAPLAVGAGEGPLALVDYFPAGARAVLVATSDAHGIGGGALDRLVRRVETAGGRLSVYYAPPDASSWRTAARRLRWLGERTPVVGPALRSEGGAPSPTLVAQWRARGHEFAPHPAVDEGLESGLTRAWRRFRDDGYGTDHVSTRTHQVLWQGWVDTPRAQRARGVRMNLDAYHIGHNLRRLDGSWAHGHLTGSGLPLRAVDVSGEVIDCYLQPTQIVDEQFVGLFGGPENLDGERAAAVAAGLVAAAVSSWPAALCAQFHADGFVGAPERIAAAETFLDGTLAACRAHRVPVWTAARWLGFLEARRHLAVTRRRWHPQDRRLELALSVPPALTDGVTVLLPPVVQGGALARAAVDGREATMTVARDRRQWVGVVVGPGEAVIDARYRRASS